MSNFSKDDEIEYLRSTIISLESQILFLRLEKEGLQKEVEHWKTAFGETTSELVVQNAMKR